MEPNHPGLQGAGRYARISGSSDRSRFVISLSEDGRAPTLGTSPSAAPGLFCWLVYLVDFGAYSERSILSAGLLMDVYP